MASQAEVLQSLKIAQRVAQQEQFLCQSRVQSHVAATIRQPDGR